METRHEWPCCDLGARVTVVEVGLYELSFPPPELNKMIPLFPIAHQGGRRRLPLEVINEYEVHPRAVLP